MRREEKMRDEAGEMRGWKRGDRLRVKKKQMEARCAGGELRRQARPRADNASCKRKTSRGAGVRATRYQGKKKRES